MIFRVIAQPIGALADGRSAMWVGGGVLRMLPHVGLLRFAVALFALDVKAGGAIVVPWVFRLCLSFGHGPFAFAIAVFAGHPAGRNWSNGVVRFMYERSRSPWGPYACGSLGVVGKPLIHTVGGRSAVALRSGELVPSCSAAALGAILGVRGRALGRGVGRVVMVVLGVFSTSLSGGGWSHRGVRMLGVAWGGGVGGSVVRCGFAWPLH